MDLPDALRNLLAGRSDPQPDVNPEEQATRLDGGQIAIDVPEGSDVDADRIEAALNGQAGSVNVRGQAGGSSNTVPVASGSDIHITDSAFDLSDWEYKAFLDDQITNLIENRVDYNTETGKWILSNDDLIPGILIRLKSLMLGKDGLEVSPTDPDSDADQRLVDHMESIYGGDADVETQVDPSKVLDRILEQNLINAVYVGRSTDLQHLNVDDLSYVKDGESGDEIYIQNQTSYTTFELDEDGDPEVNIEHTEDQNALEIGKEVLDVRMYRTPPLQAVADDVVNKMQMKRLQGRKAEIASIGGIIIKVNPPAWLSEEDYDQYVDSSDDQFGDESGRLLELVMAQQIEAALETLEDYQTATVMSIPENWETTTIELPEMDESMSSMIRDYNEAISRRLLLPLDLIELKEGPELSRNSMMQMFLDQISGWQGQVTDLFDEFAQVQAEIHSLNGDVEHHLPPIAAEDEQEIIQLFNFAGLLGLSEAESRELANTLEGVDLETDQVQDMPPEGGPEDPEEREASMQEMLDAGPDQGPDGGSGGDEPPDEGPEDGTETEASGISRQDVLASLGVDDDLDRDIEAAEYPMDPDSWPPRAAQAAWRNVGESMDTCMAHMVTEAGWDDRKAEGFCGSLRDSLHQQNPLSQFRTEAAGSDAYLDRQRIEEVAADLSDQGAIRAGQDGDPICWVCGGDAELVNETPPHEFTCDYHGLSPNHVPISQADIEAAESDVDLKPTQEMAGEAETAIRLIEDEGSDAMNDTGRSRMRQLADREELTANDVVGSSSSVANWWARHMEHTVTRSGGEFSLTEPDGDPADDHSYVAGKGWGGVPGMKWAFRKASQITGDTEWREKVKATRIEAADSEALPDGEPKLPTTCRICDENTRMKGNFRCPDCHPDTTPEAYDGELAAAGSFSEGDEVETPSGMGVVVEVRTEEFEGPDGTEEATSNNPAYVVGVEDGVQVYREDELGSGQIDAGVDNPEGGLGGDGDEAASALIEAARGDGRFSYPESWEESETPARLILLKAWAGMNGQFDCGGDCCKGEMLSSGMSEQAANRFCASMKDRVLGGWEGWRGG